MAYLIIDQFKIGLDLRKGPVTSPAQSLRVLKNAFVNAGGEIEKRKAFVLHTTAPGTIGLYGANSEFVVFQNGAPVAGARTALTPYVNKFGLTGAVALTHQRSAQFWQDTYFCAMATADGTPHCYHEGAPVVDLGDGVDCRVFETKMYVPKASVLKFSAINDPANWNTAATPANGSGFVDVSTADAFGSTVLGVERYFQRLAVFGISTIQLWQMDANPAQNAIVQTIGGTGLLASGAKTTFANGDVIYLARTGIRSLKARDASNFAVTTDVGSPVDSLVKDLLSGMTQPEIDRIQCVVEPKTGSFWIAFGSKILVLSFYPSGQISAWSEFEVPFSIDYLAANDQALAIRSGDNIYFYGDVDGESYDDTEVIVQTPFLDAKDPAAQKTFRALDAAVEGSWAIRYNVNPRAPGAWSATATVTGQTFSLDQIPMQARGTHVAFEMRTQTVGPAKFSSFVCHFDGKQPA